MRFIESERRIYGDDDYLESGPNECVTQVVSLAGRILLPIGVENEEQSSIWTLNFSIQTIMQRDRRARINGLLVRAGGSLNFFSCRLSPIFLFCSRSLQP